MSNDFNGIFLLQGIDTLEVSYYLRTEGVSGLDFIDLGRTREALRHNKGRPHKVIQLGCEEFLLSNHGTSTGFPFFMENDNFKVAFGEFNRPNFCVSLSCHALWHEGYQKLHQRFLAWAASVGFRPYKPESISRLDYAYDYRIDLIDFGLDHFVSVAEGDKQYRKNKKAQTFDFGSGEKKLRVYNKSDEINEQSGKVWFYPLWGGVKKNVWRIEWQTRGECLKTLGIRTLQDMSERMGDLLRQLATEHTSLRAMTEDSNRSRWPLHPLWQDYLGQIATLPTQGVVRKYDPNLNLEERLLRCNISMYGYLKRVAAINALRHGFKGPSFQNTLSLLKIQLMPLYDELTWHEDVASRMEEMRFGHE
jgi:hypothetical protein